MIRRFYAATLVLALLAAFVPAVAVARSDAPVRIPGEVPLTKIYADGTYRGPQVKSPFALAGGGLEYAVATADFDVTYNGFSAEAQAAFEAGVQIWERLIYSPKVIHVTANWTNLGGGGILGSAGPADVWICQIDKACPSALFEALCNCDTGVVGAGETEIIANFNSSFADWYLGTDGNVGASEIDFLSVVLHELGHGLGMLTSFYKSGASGGWGYHDGSPPPYYPLHTDLGMYNAASGGSLLTNTTTYPNPGTALGTALTSNSVYFQGTNVTAAIGGRARIYAPSPFAPGSSMSHLDEATYPEGNANALMTPFINFGEANHSPGPIVLAIFRDMGWDAEGCSTAPFTDVSNTHPFCLEIKWMKDNTISTGFGDGSYKPTQGVTRQAMSSFMARLDGASTPACTTPPFSDVPIGHAFCKEIKWMKDAGISTGFPDGTYRPADNVTRQAMSAFMARLAGATTPECASAPFSDVPADHQFCEEIKWMKDNLISTGFSDGTYRPTAVVTRQAMSAFMFRLNSLL